jgi:hypothetical protein
VKEIENLMKPPPLPSHFHHPHTGEQLDGLVCAYVGGRLKFSSALKIIVKTSTYTTILNMKEEEHELLWNVELYGAWKTMILSPPLSH